MTNRRLKRTIGILTLLAAAPLSIGLGEPEAVGRMGEGELDVYLESALERNPQLRAFKARYEAGQARIAQSSSLPDPMLQVTHFVESVQTRTGPQRNALMLTQRLPWFGKLDQSEAVASAEAEALWFAYQSQQLALVRSVAQAYYEYGYTGRSIELTRENLELLAQLEPIVEEKVRVGGELNALLRLKVEIGKVDDRLRMLEQKQVAQSARLGELLAREEASILPLPRWEAPSLGEFDADRLLDGMLASNPDLAMMRRRIQSSEARATLARLQARPDITVGLSYIQIGEPIMNQTARDAGSDPWGVVFGVSLPIWRERNKAARTEALASKEAASRDLEARGNALRAELSSALSSLKDANRRLNLYGTDLLGLARQSVDNSRSSYEAGRVGILEVIDSERSLLELQLLYWRAAADAWQQRVVLLTLVNEPLASFETISHQ